MGPFSIWHWLIILVVIIPVIGWCSIAKKAGFSPWWGLLSIVPLVNVVMLFVFAYSKWPNEQKAADVF